MEFKEIQFTKEEGLELDNFKAMDYHAVENYGLPMELMMENAGLQLANLVASSAQKEDKISIGVGNGNNGGGGLVAARRLAAWGYQVYLHTAMEITSALPVSQLERAIKFGAKMEFIETPDIWVDAYLGFSQRLPLPEELQKLIVTFNNSKAFKVALDLPTGFLGDTSIPYFVPNQVITLAAPKRILFALPDAVALYVGDLGIPAKVYDLFNARYLPFSESNILKIIR